ncbi:uncharacterized protein [Palaemon carinicauda]|uniref:uncharacterized protein n=1 Tax=Palaemon carinicauda TaxID=392227 RepID=UPI0035B59C37
MALGKYEGGIDIGGTKISNMRYADDLVLLAGTKEELQRVLRMMEEQRTDGKMERAFQDQISSGQKAFGRLRRIWKDKNISIKLKIRLLRAIVIPSVIYGVECWVLKKREEKKLLAFEMKCLRRICGVRWEDRITNERVREIAGAQDTILIRVEDIQRR